MREGLCVELDATSSYCFLCSPRLPQKLSQCSRVSKQRKHIPVIVVQLFQLKQSVHFWFKQRLLVYFVVNIWKECMGKGMRKAKQDRR